VLGLLLSFAHEAYEIPLWLMLPVVVGAIIEAFLQVRNWRQKIRGDRIYYAYKPQAASSLLILNDNVRPSIEVTSTAVVEPIERPEMRKPADWERVH